METKRKRRILVIDSDHAVSGMISKALEPEGFQVFKVPDPEDGVLKAGEILPDLIFLSLIFPGSNGLKISKSIHASIGLKEVPIVMLISYQGEIDPKYTSTIGIIDVLVKPLSAKEIVTKTVNILGADTKAYDLGEPAAAGAIGGEAQEAFSLDKEWLAVLEQGGAVTLEPGVQDENEAAPKEGPFQESYEIDETELSEEPPEIKELFGPEDTKDLTADYPGDGPEEETVPDSIGLSVGNKADDMEEFLSEEDPGEEEQGGPVEEPWQEDPAPVAGHGKSPFKKILVVFASVIVIAGISFGGLMIKKYFFSGTGQVAAPPVKEIQTTKEPVKEEAALEGQKPSDVKTEEAVPVPAAKPVEKAGPAAVAKPPVQKAPEAPRAAKEEPKALKEKSTIRYAVQVGVFGNEKNALALAEKMKQKGYDAYIQEDAAKKAHRVLIGKFETGKKALEHSRVILEKEGIKSVIYHP